MRFSLAEVDGMLVEAFEPRVVLTGGMGTKQRRATRQRLEGVAPTEERVLIATGHYINEGFDDAQLDTLFLAIPIAWKRTLAQYVGRLHRSYPTKRDVIPWRSLCPAGARGSASPPPANPGETVMVPRRCRPAAPRFSVAAHGLDGPVEHNHTEWSEPFERRGGDLDPGSPLPRCHRAELFGPPFHGLRLSTVGETGESR
jgi:hypothetical protein